MQRFIEFYGKDLSGAIAPLCGGDSVIPVDGRYGRARQIEIAKKHAQSIDRFHGKGTVVGFKLQAGPRFLEPTQSSELITL